MLEDLGDLEFVASFAAALVEDEVTVHIARAEAEIACGRADAVIGSLEGLAAEHPYREPLWVQLIIAYYVAERQSDALEAYRRLKIALAEDLGIEPGPTIRALHERVLRQEVMDAVLSDTGTTFVITDLRSANGVYAQDRRIRGSVPLADGDRIRICHHEFVFELEPRD
ncbi:DNA-binding SARP family transcriptional activator [Mycobacterium sp. AZCC_0083]|nr:DNA-binding SARP family transcriptional activator [Mycobacterium sp. AZCC_0083]